MTCPWLFYKWQSLFCKPAKAKWTVSCSCTHSYQDDP